MSEAVLEFYQSQQNNSETDTLRQDMVASSYSFTVHYSWYLFRWHIVVK